MYLFGQICSGLLLLKFLSPLHPLCQGVWVLTTGPDSSWVCICMYFWHVLCCLFTVWLKRHLCKLVAVWGPCVCVCVCACVCVQVHVCVLLVMEVRTHLHIIQLLMSMCIILSELICASWPLRLVYNTMQGFALRCVATGSVYKMIWTSKIERISIPALRHRPNHFICTSSHNAM